MLFSLCEDGAEVLDARVDAVAHLAAVGGLVGAREHRGVVPLANLLNAGLQRLALYKIKCYLLMFIPKCWGYRQSCLVEDHEDGLEHGPARLGVRHLLLDVGEPDEDVALGHAPE